MSERIARRTNKVIEIGNSKGFRTKKSYLKIAGMEEKGTEVKEALINGQHGIFIAYYIPGEQPQLEQIPEEELEKIIDQKAGCQE